MSGRPAALLVAALAPLVTAEAGAGQQPELTGYYLNVAVGADDGPFSEAGLSDFQRLRGMLVWARGPLRLDLAYEHTLELASVDRTRQGVPGLGGGRAGGEWLDLQGDVATSPRVAWRHRLDRAAVALDLGEAAELTVGRQPVSWATTLFLTPADPFAPFDPADPYREYRAGIDAARVRVFPGAFSEVDLVVRPASFAEETTITALARLRSVVAGVEMSGWAGILHDEPAASLAATATLLGAAFRTELVVRDVDDERRARLAIGVDRRFPVAGRDLYAVLEYQRDGLGAAGPEELAETLASTPASRGELLVAGRDALALQASFEAHPLWTPELLALADLGDGSVLLAPAVGVSVGAETTARLGAYVGAGRGRTDVGEPASEFGTVPTAVYLSITTFF